MSFRLGTLIHGWSEWTQDPIRAGYAKNFHLRRIRFLVAGTVFSLAPEHFLLGTHPLDRVSARNVLRGQIEQVDLEGEDALVRVRAGGISWRAHVTGEAVRDLGLAPDRPVWLAIKTQAFRPVQ